MASDLLLMIPFPVQLIETFRQNLLCVVFNTILFKLVVPLASQFATVSDLSDERMPMNFDLKKSPINDGSLRYIDDYIKDWKSTRSEQCCVPEGAVWLKNIEDSMTVLKAAVNPAIPVP